MAKAATTPKAVPTAPRSWQRVTLGFGIVNIEVGIAPAAGEGKVKGHKYDPATLARVKQLWQTPKGDTVEPVTGYEADNGAIVTFEDDELDRLKSERDKAIDLQGFVPMETIDSMYFEKSYNIWPTNVGQTKAFVALAKAMRESDRAGVGTVCLTNSTRVFVVRWSERTGGLIAHVCVYDQAMRWDALANAVAFTAAGPQPTKPEVEMARQLVESLTTDFAQIAASTIDERQEALAQAIAAKAKGAPVPVQEEEEVEEASPVDLMEALRASVATTKRQPAGRTAKAKSRTPKRSTAKRATKTKIS